MALPWDQLSRMVEEAARSAGVPPNLLAALVRHESGGDPRAVSPKGAIGLAQLMPETARALGVNPHDPWQNLLGGARYLRQQYDRFGRWDLALAAYNAGPEAVRKHGGIPPYHETQTFVSNVLQTSGSGSPPSSRQFAPSRGVFITRWEREGRPPLTPAHKAEQRPLPPLKPAKRGVTPPKIRELMKKPRGTLLPSEQRAIELWEARRAQQGALRRAAAAEAALETPKATKKKLAKEAAQRIRKLQGSVTEHVFEEAPSSVKEALEATQTGKSLAKSLGKALRKLVRFQETGWRIAKGLISKELSRPETRDLSFREIARMAVKEPEKLEKPLIRAKSPAGKALSAVVELAGSMAFDPLTYLGVGPLARLGRGIEAAIEVGARAERIPLALKKLTEAISKTEKTIKETEKAAKQYPKAARELEKAQAAVQKLRQRLREKPPVKAETRARAAQRLSEARQKARAASQKVEQLGRAAQEHEAATQRLERLSAAKKRVAALERALSKPAPRYLKFGPLPLVNVEPALQRLSRVMARLQLHPGIQPVAAAATRAFRLLEPTPKEGKTVAEYMAEKEVLPELYRRVREAGPRAMLLAEKAVEPFAKLPERARIAAAHVVEQPKRAEEIKSALPPVLHGAVDKAAEIWRTDREELTARLVQALGRNFAARLIEDYLPHIVIGHPGKKARFLEALAKDPQKVLDDIRRTAQATRLPKRLGRAAPGSKPFFTYERVFPTLAELKAYAQKHGLDVVEDVGVLDALYRHAAEKMLWMKETSEWLERIGWIKSAKAAPKDWWDAGSAFPWYRGKGLRIHPEAARLLQEVNHILKPSEELRPLLKAHDQIMGLFKGAVTSLRPAFHMVNALGNMVLMRMAGIGYSEQVAALKDAIRVLTGKHPQARQIMAWFRQAGLEGTGMFADTRQLSERVLAHIEDHLEKVAKGWKGKVKVALFPRGASLVEKATGLAAGRSFGEFTDSIMRLAAFTHFLKQGIAPHNAARLVREYMFDYGQLTPIERNLRRFFIPFYTWARFAAARSLAAMLMQPGAYTGYQHFINALDRVHEFDRDVLPPYLEWMVVLGDDETGRVIYVNPQPPWQTLFTMASREFPGDVPEAGREIISSVSPFIRGAVIAATGRDITGRKLQEEPYGERPVWVQRLINVLRQFVPAWEYEKLYPERPGAPLRVSGRLVTGLKGFPLSFLSTFDVPLAQARNILRAKKALEEYISSLKEQGLVQEVPEASQVERAEELLKRQETLLRVLKEARHNPEKRRLIEMLTSGSRSVQSAFSILLRNADLLDGTPEEVGRKIARLFSKENRRRLAAHLGKEPTVRDFLEHRRALEGSAPETTLPQDKKLQSEGR